VSTGGDVAAGEAVDAAAYADDIGQRMNPIPRTSAPHRESNFLAGMR
jgi:hypothetical protein